MQSKNLTSMKTLAALTVTFKKEIKTMAFLKIMTIKRSDISLVVYSLLQHSLTTTASVVKSFFMLRKLKAKDRNFKIENIQQNIILYLILAPGNSRIGCLYKANVMESFFSGY